MDDTQFTRHALAAGIVEAGAPALFDLLDDPLRLSAHMRRPSMALLGTTMQMSTDALGGRQIGSLIRLDGRVLGLRIGLVEVVTQREPPRAKAWRTLGAPRLLVIGDYRMGFEIAPRPDGCLLTVRIDYALPPGWTGALLGALLGARYARWCCARMVADARSAFAPADSGAPARPGAP